jgi:hypothetical protein
MEAKRLIFGLGVAALAGGILWYFLKKQPSPEPTPKEKCLQQGGTWDEANQQCIPAGNGAGHPPAVPGAPWKVSSQAYSRTNADITIAWAAVPRATHYIVWHKSGELKATVYGTTQYLQTGAYPGAPWTVAIEACNDYGCSGKGPWTTLYTAPFGG